MLKDYQAMKVAERFIALYRYYNVKIPHARHAQKSRFWKYYLKVAEKYCEREEWDAYKFVDAQFDYRGKIMPHELDKPDSWEVYTMYIDKVGDNNIPMQIINTLKVINLWCKKNGKPFSCEAFLNSSYGNIIFKRDELSIYFICISKTALKKYKTLTNILSDDIIEVKQAIIYADKKLLSAINRVLKEDSVFFKKESYE